jgi:hypothetical protein
MPPLTSILRSIERSLGSGERSLWHGTGVSPDELARGAGSLVEPKFSSKFFRSGTGGMVQGPGLYAAEPVGVGKHYADIVSGAFGKEDRQLVKGRPLDDYAYSRLRMAGVSLADEQHYNNTTDRLKILAYNARTDSKFTRAKEDLLSQADTTPEMRDIISGLHKDDFTLPNRYLYRLAFPKEKYLDWYNPDAKDAENIYSALKKGTPNSQYRGGYVPGYKGEHILEDVKHAISSERTVTGKNPAPTVDDIAKIFENAGMVGTKYRGDAQQAKYFNYVLQRPERARILDAFKFGIPAAVAGGVGMESTQ